MCAWAFGDSFDCYAVANDASSYWDGGSSLASNVNLVAGRFAGSQALSAGNTPQTMLAKSSGQNDAVHHIFCAFRQTVAISGANLCCYLQLLDGTTSQCCINFRTDGVILLTSGAANGTTLATYAGAVTAQNTWFVFEFEVVINNTTGSFKVRKNGNAVDDHSTTGINTRGGTANNYANKLAYVLFQNIGANAQQIDDLLWRSDASSVPWVGDVRCYTRMPATDVSTQFARSPSPVTATQSTAQASTASKAANAGLMSQFTAPYTGTVTTVVVSLNTGGTGNLKAAIYDATRTTVIGSASNAVVNPVSGLNTVTFGTPPTVTKGTIYFLAFDQDTTLIYNVCNSQYTFTTPYASFPAASPVTTGGAFGPVFTVNITPTISAEYVNETLQDGTTSYVYDSTVGHADFYNLGTLSPQPASVVAVTTRAFMQKSDAGAKSGAVQIKSGATTVASPTLNLSTSFGWTWRTDVTDPATGSAWTNGAVNVVQVGPKCVA